MTTAPAYDNSVRIGYTRVSTRAQEHQAQLDALAAAHCREIIVETASTRGDRPGHTSVRSLAKYARVSDEGLLNFQADTDPAARRASR